MNIDNLTSLILSVYNNKGVYALLLGSGISLEAKIMSGWKVTEDLIKKVAVAQGEEIPDDQFEWYRNKCGVEAEYSNLLEQLGKKPSELESILRPYFEASEEELSDITGLMPNDIRTELLDESDVIKVRPNKIQLKF